MRESGPGRLKARAAAGVVRSVPRVGARGRTRGGRWFKQKVRISSELERKYLEAALTVMNKHGVKVNDLHAFMKPLWSKYAIADNNVHFTKLGSRKLGEKVAKAINSFLSVTVPETKK